MSVVVGWMAFLTAVAKRLGARAMDKIIEKAIDKTLKKIGEE